MCCWSEYIDAYIIIPRHCYPMHSERVYEYDQEIPQSQTADKPIALGGRATQQSRDTRKSNEEKQPALSSTSRWLQKREYTSIHSSNMYRFHIYVQS